MTARSFVWLSIGGGAWGLASNWADTTDGTSPSLLAPGAQDSVVVAGPTGAAVQTITGPGLAAAALFTGNSLLSGSFSIANLTLGQGAAGGLLELAVGTALQSGTANIVSGSLLAGGGSNFSVSGTLGLGSGGGQAAFNVTGGGMASVMSLFLGAGADSIYVDTASILEVGGTGQGQAGRLTIDAGGLLAGQGNANEFGAVVNNGTISAQGGTLAVGTLSGTGSLVIGAGATLALDSACGPGQSVSFAGANATLALQAEFDAPSGTLALFAPGDAIDVEGSLISQASFVAASQSGGTLTLYYGTQVADRLLLAGNYANDVFLTAGDGAGGTLITVAAGASGNGGTSPGTSTPDQYVWTGQGTLTSGRWNQAGYWSDVTRNQSPANLAPGVHDLVTIAGQQAAFDVISGPGNAASLTITGEVALTGAIAATTLAIGNTAGAYAAGTLDLVSGATLAATSASVSDGELSVAGSLSALSVAGTLVVGGTPFGVGQPSAALDVTSGGAVQAGTLQIGGGSANSIVTDPTGTIEIGTAGHAAAGALTVDAGAQLNGNGSINPYGLIFDNGTILASGGTLSLGTVSGTGSLLVGVGATLELLAATADPITLLGSINSGSSVLAFANARAAPTGTIAGLLPGDALDLEGSPLTAVQFSQASGGTGTLVLLYGSAVVARLAVSGSFANQRFVLLPDGNGGTMISLTTATSGGGGNQQTGTDQLAWANPVSGAWGRNATWTDNTTGNAATAPPGPQTPVIIAGPGGTVFEDITGQGTCASLSASGNTILSGTFATGQLTGGAGALVLGAGTTLTAAQAAFAGTDMLTSGNGALLSVSGTVSVGLGAVLNATSHGVVQCGTLALGGGAVILDGVSSIEVGTLGGAALGAITVDFGALASGSGALSPGSVVDNGTILAQGGTLAVGPVSGAGVLQIGTGATLALLAADSSAIGFAGNGATLAIESAALPTGIISGFQTGDGIVLGDTPIDSVSYQPGANGIGTLTLGEAGQVVGQLLMAGTFAGAFFAVQPDGSGTEITLGTQAASGPPPGTATPDQYVWQGGHGPLWSTAGNWSDATSGQLPALVAPGLNDLVSVTGGNGNALLIDGPANAAALSLSGTVALAGAFSFGTLAVGGGGGTGILALGGGATVAAGTAAVDGGIALNGGALSVGGTLVLGMAGQTGFLDVVSGNATAGALLLAAASSAVLAGDAGSIEIGGLQGAAAGSVQIDADGLLSGAGNITAAGGIVDYGTITAAGGTLSLGAVSGSGTMLVGVGAELALTDAASSQLTADFAGGGTLALGQPALATAPQIADFGVGDQILLTAGGATSASYAQTAPNTGVLTIEAGAQVLAQLTLLGVQAGLEFTVAASTGGGTILTAVPDNTSGPGSIIMPSTSVDSSFETNQQQMNPMLQAAGLDYALPEIDAFLGGASFNEWFSADGQAPPATSTNWAPFLGYLEVVGPLTQTGPTGVGPLSAIAVPQNGADGQPGTVYFHALIAEGGEPLILVDNSAGGDLIVGNAGGDTIYAHAGNDTLVGALGSNTTFSSNLTGATNLTNGNEVFIHGGGNDTYYTNADTAAITTSGGNSRLFLGSDATVTLNGADTVICGGGQSVDVTVNAAVGLGANYAFGPSSRSSSLNFHAGNTQSIVVGNGGEINLYGGAGNGTTLFANSSAVEYLGGTGAANIVGGSSTTYVSGGAGPVDVFGGSGNLILTNATGGSVAVVNQGNNNIAANGGLNVWLGGSSNNTVSGAAGAFVYGGTNDGTNLFNAGAGSETLWGGLGTDVFQGGTGHALLQSGGGHDSFDFLNGNDAHDTIGGFVVGQDSLNLSGFGTAAPAITYAYGDSILNLQDGTQIVVYGVTNLTASSIHLT